MYLSFQKISQAISRVSSVVTDAYFNLVTLLLNTTTTNGAQNNTFLDSSSNAFTITRNGNTTQGTFTPFSQTGWSNNFNGSSDYLTTSSNTALNLGANDFTVECWIYTPVTTANQIIIAGVNASTGTGSWQLQINYTGQVRFYCNYNGGTALDYNVGTGTIPSNTWNNITVTRNGANLRVFLNGTQLGTTNTTLASFSIDNAISNYRIGQTVDAFAGWYFNGYISNLRVVIGTALYTSNFTPSTTPLTAVTNTKLLTCQSNRFLDNSTNALTFTTGGTPSVQAFSPFAPTAAYSTSVVGGSGYFDGSGDYLNLTLTGGLGSGDFTVEYWAYFTTFVDFITNISTTRGSTGWSAGTQAAAQIVWYSSGAEKVRGSTAMKLNSWNHIAFVRSSGTLKGYLNGVQDGTTSTETSNFTDTTCWVGGLVASSEPFTGYMSSVRIVRGTAVYTANFTPPTAPLTAITNTQLLLSATNAGIYDSTAKNDLETVGNAQVSTTQAKWGTTSMYFDGTGDWLLMPSSQTFAFGSGNYTVEFWVYYSSASASYQFIDARGATYTNGGFALYTTGGSIYVQYGSTALVTATAPSANTWHHIAATRSGTSTKLFIDGTQAGSTATDSNSYGAYQTFIGQFGGGSGYDLNGYIDDLRVTKGYARYTANFTVPSAAFPVQ